MNPEPPSFGQYLRGARLGYRYDPTLGLMVRVDAEGPPWRIDFRRCDSLPSHGDKTKHRVWWEGPNPWKLLKFKPEPNRTYYVGEDGASAEGR